MKFLNILFLASLFQWLSPCALAVSYDWRTLAGVPGVAGAVDSPSVAAARFRQPSSVAVGPGGVVFVADWGNHTIRKIMPNGVVTTIAGSAGVAGNSLGFGGQALLTHPYWIDVDSAMNVYFVDWNYRICKISPDGAVSLVLQSNRIDSSCAVNRAGDLIYFFCSDNWNLYKVVRSGTTWTGSLVTGVPIYPTWLAMDDSGVLYITSYYGGQIWKSDLNGLNWSWLAGGAPGNVDGPAATAKFTAPWGIAVSGDGTAVYVSDTGTKSIRKLTKDGSGIWTVSTIAGDSIQAGGVDGTGASARFYQPEGLSLNRHNGSDQLIVPDYGSHAIRKISLTTSPAVVTTLAGFPGLPGSSDGPNMNATYNDPMDTVLDSAGNLYVADYLNCTIRKVAPNGTVVTLAGVAGAPGSVDGTGSAARFRYPGAISLAGNGNLFVSDVGNSTIRMITPAGVVTTVAGLAGTAGSADGQGSAARFNTPRGLAASSSGSVVYVADSGNHTIRKVEYNGSVWTASTLAGAAGQSGSTDVASGGSLSNARFANPNGVALNAAGNRLYVADTDNHTVRVINLPAATVQTFAGVAGQGATVDGYTYSGARLTSPMRVAVGGSAENVYITQFDHCIRKVVTSVRVSTIAGSAGIQGKVDGVAILAPSRLSYPIGICSDAAGNVYFADSGNHAIRKVTLTNVTTTVSGISGSSGAVDSNLALFRWPSGLALDPYNVTLYVSDSYNHTIRNVSQPGNVKTYAGVAGSLGATDGPLNSALLTEPGHMCSVGNGLYFCDYVNNAIRYAGPSGVTTIAGLSGHYYYGSSDGVGSGARFNGPSAICADGAGNLYVVDSQNQTIRKIAFVNGLATVTTLAGTPGASGSADGTGSAARFNYPNAIAVNAAGNLLYVTDTQNHTIRKLTLTGGGWAVTTLTGVVGSPGWIDGNVSVARFRSPSGIALVNGVLYVAEKGNHTVRMIAADGTVSTIGGLGLTPGSSDGPDTVARFNQPYAITVDPSGIVYVADVLNQTIRVGIPYP